MGKKGVSYSQAGQRIATKPAITTVSGTLGIPDRSPFNAVIPNKRQTVNDGIALFAAVSNTGAVLPSKFAVATPNVHVFLFSEDVPSRLSVTLKRSQGYTQLRTATGALDAPAHYVWLPEATYENFPVLASEPQLITGYSAPSKVADYGEFAVGPTVTNGVTVRGFESYFALPVDAIPTPFVAITGTGPDYPPGGSITSFSEGYIDFSSRSTVTKGFAPFFGYSPTDASAEFVYPVVLSEQDYTQAIQDNGNVIEVTDGFYPQRYIVVGIYDQIPSAIVG